MDYLIAAWGWVVQNKEWFLSGLGIALASVVLWLVRRLVGSGNPSPEPQRNPSTSMTANHGQVFNVAGDVSFSGPNSLADRHEVQRESAREAVAEEPGPPVPGQMNAAESGDEAKRVRDREVMEHVLRNVSCFALEEILDELDYRRVHLDQLWYVDWLDEFKRSSEFHFYDQELRKAVEDLISSLGKATSHSEIMEEHPQDSNLYRVPASMPWMTRSDRDRELNVMLDDSQKARFAHAAFMQAVRDRFPDLSLYDLDVEARRRHAHRLQL